MDIVQTKRVIEDDDDDEDWGDFPSIKKPLASNSDSASPSQLPQHDQVENVAEQLRDKIKARPIGDYEEYG